jgi:hypothetical protein
MVKDRIIKVLAVSGVILAVLIMVIVALTLILSTAPFEVPNSKLESSYILGLEELGDYKNIYKNEESSYSLFDKEATEDNQSGILVRASDEEALFTDFLKTYEDASCTAKAMINGFQGSTAYYKGKCDDAAYYIYLNRQGGGVKGILFETIKFGEVELEKFIQSYITQ